ncbi:MAG TPA: helix-turn-helix transcriptional regulator, partial [Verrucomicrobiae bacterium]
KNTLCCVYKQQASCSSNRWMPSKPHHRRILGERIRVLRKEAGFTQEQLAEKSDLHHNFIGEVERANMEISLTSMIKIAKALKVKVRDLVDEL